MLCTYDLYDLYAVFVNIRQYPDYPFNKEILIKIMDVLENRYHKHDANQIRTALQTIPSLDKEVYGFVFVKNVYTYHPSILKDDYIYNILIESCKHMLKVMEAKNSDQLVDLADCLHHLPIIMVENKFSVPKKYWKHEIKDFRNKWDKNFLTKIQKQISKA